MRIGGHGGCNPRLQRLSRGRSGRLAMRAGLGAVRCAQEARLKSPGDCAALDRGGDRDSGLLPRPQKKSAHFKAARLRGRRVLEAPRSAGRGGGLPGAGVGGDGLTERPESGSNRVFCACSEIGYQLPKYGPVDTPWFARSSHTNNHLLLMFVVEIANVFKNQEYDGD